MSLEVPFLFETEKLLWSVDNIYSSEECANFIKKIDRSRLELATNNPLFRNQDRIIEDNSIVAKDLFFRLRSHLPEKMGNLILLGLNERLRMYRYRVGQYFAPHTDHWYRPSDDRISLHSLLVYFNEDFEGGETKFIEPIEDVIIPHAGRVAIFQHKLTHEGCIVRRGTKYAMRTDVFYGQRAIG